jgi:hypothetical protein
VSVLQAAVLNNSSSTKVSYHPVLHASLQEFQPWLKWIIFDAVLTLVIGQLVKYFERLRPLFEAVGWA